MTQALRREAVFYREGRSRHVTRVTRERRNVCDDKDDSRFIRFVKALKEWRSQRGNDEAADHESKTFDEHVEEAERRFWSSRGDPATEAKRMLNEARRRRTNQQKKTQDG